MKKYCIIVLVILLFTTMISCGKDQEKKMLPTIELDPCKEQEPSPEEAKKIREDMTYAEVTEIIGLPQRILPNLCYEYDLSDNSCLQVAYRPENGDYYVNMILRYNITLLPSVGEANKIREWMTYDEIIDILGFPQRLSPKSECEYIYDLEDGSYLAMVFLPYSNDNFCRWLIHCNKKDLPSREQAEQIHKGMTYDEVTEILGLPQRDLLASASYAYAYDLSDGSYLVVRYVPIHEPDEEYYVWGVPEFRSYVNDGDS